MLQNKIFSNILKKTTSLALSGALMATLTPSIIWGMDTQEDQKCASINRVPKHVLGYIFSFLDQPTELGRLALVSKKWKEVSEMDIRWKRFGVESKKEFAEFMKSPAITILNKLAQTSHEIGIAYGSGLYFTELNSKMKGESFDECIMNIELPTEQETIIRFCDFPNKTTALGPQKIYGLTKLPAKNLDMKSSGIHIDMNKSPSSSEPYMVIWDILGKEFTLFPGACEEFGAFFRENSL